MMHRRLGEITVTALMIFILGTSFSGDVSFSAQKESFTDVAASYWGHSFIEFAAEVEIIKGYPLENGRFKFLPEKSVTKEESMQMIYTAVVNSGTVAAPPADLKETYIDLLKEHAIAPWAWECVSFGLDNNILDLKEVATFHGQNGSSAIATRQEVARWTAKAIDRPLLMATSLEYPDANQIAPENTTYVDLLRRMEIMVGDNTGTFKPKDGIRRAEFAVICTRVYDLSKAPYAAEREYHSFSGESTGSSESLSRIDLTTASGVLRTIQVEPAATFVVNGVPVSRSQGFAFVNQRKPVVITADSFGQVHIQADVVVGHGRVIRVENLGTSAHAITFQQESGSVWAIQDDETILVDPLSVGSTYHYITDGVMLIEAARSI